MFDSCSAYHILFLSHCVPNPPDKGDRIRACHELRYLAARYRVHLVCFARSEEEAAGAEALRPICESVHVELLSPRMALARSAVHFALGGCLSQAYFGSHRVRSHVAALRDKLAATVVYSSSVAQFAPRDLPLILDLVDVDSEKWLQYGRERTPGFPYRWEGTRLRKLEVSEAARSQCTLLATRQEADLFTGFAGAARVRWMENGVDLNHFDPAAVAVPEDLAQRRYVAFVGAMNYYPNADAVCRFAAEVLPELNGIEFLIVGRDPVLEVLKLHGRDGITVTGSVPDVRPYVAGAQAVVAPLRIARGIQNKVLEALAMGKPALVSPAVGATFGDLPVGVVRCETPSDYARALVSPHQESEAIREGLQRRFDWSRNLATLDEELQAAWAGCI